MTIQTPSRPAVRGFLFILRFGGDPRILLVFGGLA